MNVRHLVPDRSITDENECAENREPREYTEGGDRLCCDGPDYQPAIRDECDARCQHQVHRQEKAELAAHDVKYCRKDHDQRQADSSEGRESRSDASHRRQDQADTPKKLTDTNEYEQALRHGGKPCHWLLKGMVPHVRPVTQDFAETSEAEEDAPRHLQDPKCNIHALRFRSGGSGSGGNEVRFLLSCCHCMEIRHIFLPLLAHFFWGTNPTHPKL